MTKRPRNRKRRPGKAPLRNSFGSKLGRVSKLINKKHPAEALQALDQLVSAEGQTRKSVPA